MNDKEKKKHSRAANILISAALLLSLYNASNA